MSNSQKQVYKAVRNVQEGLELLDTEPNTMFAFVPLQKNDFLTDFTAHIRKKELCSYFSAIFNDTTRGEFDNMFPPELSPFSIIDSELNGEYRLIPSRLTGFNNIAGKPVDFAPPPDLFLSSIAIQSDNRRSISKYFHRDSSLFTVNIYSEGDPLRYRLNGDELIHLKAPAIFMHRGIRHKFGIDAAVEHQGRAQTGPRANVAYDFDSQPPKIEAQMV